MSRHCSSAQGKADSIPTRSLQEKCSTYAARSVDPDYEPPGQAILFLRAIIIIISNRIVFIEDGSKLIFAITAQSEP